MTTPAAAALYLAQHNLDWEGQAFANHNPHDFPLAELPVIYGFNNGGSNGWYYAQLLAADGTALGGHLCSAEGYMPADLGCLAGSRPDRHESFGKHYPNGYRMEFVPGSTFDEHVGLNEALLANDASRPKESQS
mgnify:FL=1|tara:strand:- start:37150 stop:37551 length:402 start_codon:yes stop_codon:yes gene_type:complete